MPTRKTPFHNPFSIAPIIDSSWHRGLSTWYRKGHRSKGSLNTDQIGGTGYSAPGSGHGATAEEAARRKAAREWHRATYERAEREEVRRTKRERMAQQAEDRERWEKMSREREEEKRRKQEFERMLSDRMADARFQKCLNFYIDVFPSFDHLDLPRKPPPGIMALCHSDGIVTAGCSWIRLRRKNGEEVEDAEYTEAVDVISTVRRHFQNDIIKLLTKD